ncbi:ABC-F family ATP-binding cassette domain-containing protein [Dichotomicrobium thermohalophilum]|uniref:ATP-binding cassette subfamily F protein 3 n=1 Tax=Dichotomicrobium thermohalophilum TaxID=933063 RepID=A0A397Q9Z4_9HYPH|nr:ABC-F family ATP-binding cassette domain-containing protein [Dichotomicrobium thermohalophilum]RIA56615.1 ATP-binding cassette subfamily F protein 3 [Dichotomicrobium thermohalophilum]
MLHINDLTYRIEGRPLFEGATAAIPSGHKVGLVGRNGAGKSTLLRLITGEIAPDEGSISIPKNARIGQVAQEAPGGPENLLDTVLAADTERTRLLAEAETATNPERISEIHLRLNDIDAHAAPARAATILAGLGFDETAQAQPCSAFSGGWRMRVALASVLFAAPDLLLLDEPTNYLDLEGVMWLENFLRSYPHTVIVVSHDRDILNSSMDAILHLENRKLTLYSGGYDKFEETRREQQRLQLKLKKKQDEMRRHMEAFVERFRAKATKARQAQSRLKALAKMQPIAAAVEEQVTPFRFPSPARPLGNPLIRIENAAVGYDPDKPVLRELNLRLDVDDRIALLGANGNGKSTLAKLLAGRLEPTVGHRRASKKLETGFFAQHQMDDLDPAKSPYDYIATLMDDATEAQKRAKLGQLGFGADKADTKCANLSGGEKARLLMALAAFGAPHLLILDEPTNHLDVDSREALIQGLNDYEGAVILISHDRHLIEACADRLWLVADGTAQPYDGDIASYRAQVTGPRPTAPASDRASATNSRRSREEDRRAAAARRAELAPLKKAIKQHEERMETLQAKLAKLDEKLADPALYDETPDKARDFARLRGELAKELEQAEEDWLAASEEYETAATMDAATSSA